jgi:hypothetical protein
MAILAVRFLRVLACRSVAPMGIHHRADGLQVIRIAAQPIPA